MLIGYLTPRQREVLSLAVSGLSQVEIARRLWLSAHTVWQHMSAVRVVFNAATAAEAVAKAAAVMASEHGRAACRLTARQRQAVSLVGKGYTATEAGRLMGIGKQGVYSHVRDAKRAMGARNINHAVVIAAMAV